jgi:methionyl-tRNA synthetase
VLGDLLEACRVVSLAFAPFMPHAARRVHDQLGLEFMYDEKGNGQESLGDLVMWGSAVQGGKIGTPEILFPRVEIDAG